MEKRGFKKTLAIYLSLALVSMISFGTALTTAAYIIIEKHNQNINVDLDYSRYFGKLTGTVSGELGKSPSNPYLIENSNHLRNLSYLVNSGFLDETHYLQLAADITWDKKAPLIPIGTDQCPFISHLTGTVGSTPDNVSKIHGLRVEGDNLADVGMFGYVGESASIANFVLDSPVIVSYGQNFNPKKLDLNPIRELTKTNNLVFTEENLDPKISLTPSKYTDTKNEYATTFSVNFPKINDAALEYDLGNVTQKAVLSVSVSDPSFFQTIDKTDGKYTFTCKSNLTAPSIPHTNKKSEGDYITITINAMALCKTPTGNRLANLTLERFVVFYNYAKSAIVATVEDSRCFRKTIYPKLDYLEDNIDGERILYKFDDIRALYVGAIAGRLDGAADRIGVHNVIFDIRRPFISNSLLIGKSIDDDNKKTITKDAMSNLSAIGTNNIAVIEAPKNLINFKRGKNQNRKVLNADFESGNRYVSSIYHFGIDNCNDKFGTTSQGFSETGGFELNTQNIFKIYDKNGKPNDKNYVGDLSQKLVKVRTIGSNDSVEYDYTGKSTTSTEVNAISMSKPMATQLTNLAFYPDKDNSKPDHYPGFQKVLVSNALNFWTTAKHDRGKAKKLGNGGLEFSLEFSIDYLYFDDGEPDQNGVYNELEVKVIDRAIGKKRYGAPSGKHGIGVYFGKPHMQEVLSTTINCDLDSVPFEANAPGILPGSTAYPFSYVKARADGSNPLLIKSVNNSLDSIHTVKTLSMTIEANTIYQRGDNSSLVVQDILTGLFPSFYLGFKQSNRNFSFDILGVNLMMSNKRGNSESSTGSLDFIGQDLVLPLNSNGTWKSTQSKIYAKTITDVQETVLGPDEKYDPTTFTRVSATHPYLVTGGNYDVSNYLIAVKKISNSVECRYNIIGANDYTTKTSAKYDQYFHAQNTVGFPKPHVSLDKAFTNSSKSPL